MTILRLAIPCPLRRTFDYMPPADFTGEDAARLRPGMRFAVPFGRQRTVGILLECTGHTPVDAKQLRHATQQLDDEPLLDGALLRLCRWAATYYHHPLGEVVAAALPPALRRPGGRLAGGGGEPGWRLTARGKGLPEGPLHRAPKQAAAIALLQAEGEVPAARMQREGISREVLRNLVRRDLIEKCRLAAAERPFHSNSGLRLTAAQQAAVESVAASAGQFDCHLLEGVTGSGKTEVYLQAIARVLEAPHSQVLVLVPEIGLTPQTLARFAERFDAPIAVLHSGISEGARQRAWEQARAGAARIVIGTRSAVFTPLAHPALIVVDEEHDISYKQQDGFRYSARDVAVKRGQLHGCPVLLGSATPSLETLRNCVEGRYRHHRLPTRAGGGEMPVAQVLDIRHKPLEAGFCGELLAAMEHTLRDGRQVLVFLNRRGYAPLLRCHDCGWIAQCSACDARLTLHKRDRRLRCHHCGGASTVPLQCPDCSGRQMLTSGLGTEQSEEFLSARFPDWPVYRVDSDSMRGRQAMGQLIEAVDRGEPCILLGTQMLTKGHHFPGVALVAVVDVDAGLFSADFRGEERMAQLLTQVAGRAGRADDRGRMLLQSHYPGHPVLQAMLQHSYTEQAAELLAARRQANMPPWASMLLLRADARSAETAEAFLATLRRQCEPRLDHGVSMIGPLPAPMQRRAGRFRSQLTVLADNRALAQRTAAAAVKAAETLPAGHDLNWSIDVDPQDIF